MYVPTGLKKNKTGMLQSLSTPEKTHPDDTNVFASNIFGKYENRPNNLHSVCLADFASSCVSKNIDDLLIEPDEIKSYTVPVSNINDVKSCVLYIFASLFCMSKREYLRNKETSFLFHFKSSSCS